MVDAEDGYFKEASWTQGSTAYPPVSSKAAESLVRQEMERMGLDTRLLDEADLQLVHHLNPYFPNWEAAVAGHNFAVGQDGSLSVN